MIIKLAGWADGLLAAGKALMGNPTIRNAAIGTGVGAVAGAVEAKPGERLGGALRGGAIGGTVGGVGTAGTNVVKSFNKLKSFPGVESGQALSQAFSLEGKSLANTANSASKAFQMSRAQDAVKSGVLPAVSLPAGTSIVPKAVPPVNVSPSVVPAKSFQTQDLNVPSINRGIGASTKKLTEQKILKGVSVDRKLMSNVPPGLRSKVNNMADYNRIMGTT